MFKFNYKDVVNDVLLVRLLLTLNISHLFLVSFIVTLGMHLFARIRQSLQKEGLVNSLKIYEVF